MLFAGQISQFIHERMIECAGVGVQRRSLDAQLLSGLAPAGNSGENFAENFLRFSGFESKTRGRRERTGDGRLLLTLGDGSLTHTGTIHFRHRVEIIGR